MGQLITKPKAKVVKEDINQDYQTYGKEGELDYAVDHNEQYQPSDYDEMEETSEDYECSKVSVLIDFVTCNKHCRQKQRNQG